MALFNRTHERRLSRLMQAITRHRRYNQSKYRFECGSPACIMGHADAVFGTREITNAGGYYRFFFGVRPKALRAAMVWDRDFTGVYGCDSAGRSGKKAIAFLRQKATDLKAALAA